MTIRPFRETFADEIRGAGFTEAVTPFISAISGFDPLQDRELRERGTGNREQGLKVTPQFIGKDPVALRACLEKVKSAGYDTADLNCGCPYPMVRNKGRGSGILRTPDILRRMLEVGCDVMGPGKFSIKARLGVDRNGELLGLMPMINEFPLRFLTVHARTARQMYGGIIDDGGLGKVAAVSKVPVVRNGDVEFPLSEKRSGDRFPVMIGRSFVRWLGTREDSGELLSRYIAASQSELCGDRPVLGRMKELIAYWKELPRWRRRWDIIKLCRSVDELKSCLI
ncbi:MAG: tRNA-dihydrouridine synthase family protein [Kiritimatiellae bacterium]|nr:tRNA-dihydrouridine synthase family protein [Kiritimatiellia bacterium]